MQIILERIYLIGSANFGLVCLAVAVGLYAVILMINAWSSLGGRLKSAIAFFISGVSLNVVALVWSVLFVQTDNVDGLVVVIQNAIILSGMVCFLLASRGFVRMMLHA